MSGFKSQGDTPMPSRPDSEPGDSIEMLTNQMAKQHSIYGEEISQLQAVRQNLVDEINYTDERIRQFETARDRVKRSLQAVTGQDEKGTASKVAERFGGTGLVGPTMGPLQEEMNRG